MQGQLAIAAAIGLAVGVLLGLTGMGGGSLVTPLLIFAVGLPPAVAVGTDLLFASIVRVVGSLIMGRMGRVRVDILWRLVAGSLPAVLLGQLALRRLPAETLNSLLTVLLGLVLVVVSLVSLLREELRLPITPRKKHAFLAGFVVGLSVQFTSVGAGVLIGFALVNVARMDPRIAAGTVMAYGLAVSLLSLAGYAALGRISYPVAAALTAGGLPGLLLGAALSSRIDAGLLRRIINLVILAIGAGVLAFSLK